MLRNKHMTSVFEVRTKMLSREEMSLRMKKFIEAGRQAKELLASTLKPNFTFEDPLTKDTDLADAALLPKLGLLELEIFCFSVEKSALREQVEQSEAKFNQIFKVFHQKRKDFLKSSQASKRLKERLEGFSSEAASIA